MALIRLTSNLIDPDYDDFQSEDYGHVLIPWPNSEQPRHWSIARA